MKVARQGRLVLEDGSVWEGQGFGGCGTRLGEVVFNTGMTGYQEILTDPSYAGQIVVMTTPHIGNTGMNTEDDEARAAFLRGFVVREVSPQVSNWRASCSLPAWLEEREVIGLSEIDTRSLTRRLRERGSLKGILCTDESLDTEALLAQVKAWQGLEGIDLVKEVSCEAPYAWEEATAESWHKPRKQAAEKPKQRARTVVVMDFGAKHNILRRLVDEGCKVTVVPASTTAEEILALAPDGVMLSNGPGDPSAVTYAVETIRGLLGKVPLFGICLGHQLLALALGGRTYKLKFGHHGGNQPVKELQSGRVEICTHNHNFAVDPESLPDEVVVTHENINDGYCEGLIHRGLQAQSVQYHPEAAPGPHDASELFDAFIALMDKEEV